MIISNTWVEIFTGSGGGGGGSDKGISVQKHGTNNLTVAYAATVGAIVDTYSVTSNQPAIWPGVQQGLSIWAKAINGDVSITVQDQ